MTLITGNEPAHWHRTTADGKVLHNLPDPRTLPGYVQAYLSVDEKAYVRHLEQHERNEDPSSTVPLPNDPPSIVSMLNWMTLQREKLDVMSGLIHKARVIRQQGTPDSDNEALQELAASFRREPKPAGVDN